MKIEKLNEDKIRITFNNNDLKENNLDVHSFMSNSIENQSLFLNMLDEAEREVGFITDNYKLSIDAIALSNGSFILTVTRLEQESLKSTRVQAYRKEPLPNSPKLIYQFANFDDLCNFRKFLTESSTKLTNYFPKNNSLYQYMDSFFLILQNLEPESIPTLTSITSEFATAIEYSDMLFHKLKEYGKFISENALHSK